MKRRERKKQNRRTKTSIRQFLKTGTDFKWKTFLFFFFLLLFLEHSEMFCLLITHLSFARKWLNDFERRFFKENIFTNEHWRELSNKKEIRNQNGMEFSLSFNWLGEGAFAFVYWCHLVVIFFSVERDAYTRAEIKKLHNDDDDCMRRRIVHLCWIQFSAPGKTNTYVLPWK